MHMAGQIARKDTALTQRAKGNGRESRRLLELLGRYRLGEPVPQGCPLQKALSSPSTAK